MTALLQAMAPRALGAVGRLEPKVNVRLLGDVLAQITDHPETWTQENWRCGTGMCVAGWAAELAGGQWAAPLSDWFVDEDLLKPEPIDDSYGEVQYTTAAERARLVLGLTRDEANTLFAAHNTLPDIYDIAGRIFARAVSQREVTK